MMNVPVKAQQHVPLFSQLAWFIHLRWAAVVTILVGSWIDQHYLHWYPHPIWGMWVGGLILVYNLILSKALSRLHKSGDSAHALQFLAWIQLLLDMACLTLLTLWTGGVQSPLRTFFVLHMVFASLLLPRLMAYGSAAAAALMLVTTLWFTSDHPVTRQDKLALITWCCTLLLTVFLANRITRSLRRQRRRLLKQNRQIKKITRQLRRQQKAMIQHEKMIAMGQMAAGITHEIANPLASMDSVLQLMQRRPEKLRPEAVTTLRDQVERINQIIQQMKAFAHPVEMQRQLASLNECVEQTLEMVRFDPRMKNVKIHREFSPDVGAMEFMPHALQQVLVNLVVNALDAMHEKPDPVLTLRTLRRDDGVVIEITDTGAGIHPEHMPRLFEPFFTTKPVGKGTGLGLSISYTLIQKQGGTISCKSLPGQGTTFIIRLPHTVPSHERDAPGTRVGDSEKSTA